MAPQEPVSDDGLDLGELVRALWRARWTIAGVTLVAALVAAGLSLFVLPPVYESRTLIQVSRQSAPAYATPQAAARVLTSLSFLRPIAQQHGIRDVRQVEGMVRVDPVRGTDMVQVRIRDRDPRRLQRLTDAVVEAFLHSARGRVEQRRRLAELRLREVSAQLATVEQTLRATRAYLQRLQAADGSTSSQSGLARSLALGLLGLLEGTYNGLLERREQLRQELTVLEPPMLVQVPYIPDRPVSPRPALNALMAAVVGFMVATIGILLAGTMQEAEVEQGSRIPVRSTESSAEA